MTGRRLDKGRLRLELLAHLRRYGVCSAAELCASLGVSQASFSRLVRASDDEVLVFGRARATRYAARRRIADLGQHWPVYEIDQNGQAHRFGLLHAVEPRGFFFETDAELPGERLYDDLPYFLYDLRPSGFLGRLIPRRHPELELPMDIRLWSAEHCLRYLTRYGCDPVGNLVIGDEALQAYLMAASGTPETRDRAAPTESRYAELAANVLAAGPAGSSAAGEQPKFLTRRTDGARVLVKFSPPVCDALSQRLADLLVCEHFAAQSMAAQGHAAVKTRLLQADARTFLEAERFDRTGDDGRVGVISLHALDAEFVGSMRRWRHSAAELARKGVMNAEVLPAIRWQEVFGQLIANTDMHPGNLSFLAQGARVIGLSPAYDMTPMLYAPSQNQLVPRRFEPPAPHPEDGDVWQSAWKAATAFWRAVAACGQISTEMRAIAEANHAVVTRLERLGALLPR